MTEDFLVEIYYIEKMTIDLFEFWLEYDMEDILSAVQLLSGAIKSTPKGKEAYFRSLRLIWKEFGENEKAHLTNVAWAQINTDIIRLEFTSGGQVATDLGLWLRIRFGASIHKREKTSENEKDYRISLQPAQKLTPTETKVAKYLAQGKTHEQIAKLLGNKTVHAARKHAQSIAKKWGTTQYLEVLRLEAQKRGFSSE